MLPELRFNALAKMCCAQLSMLNLLNPTMASWGSQTERQKVTHKEPTMVVQTAQVG